MTENTLSRRQVRFVSALLTTTTVAEAARLAGISQRTAYRYLENAGVQSAIGRSLDDTLTDATCQATTAVTRALAVLQAILDDPSSPAPCRVGAARLILEAGPRYRQTLDLASRISVVEDLTRIGLDEPGL